MSERYITFISDFLLSAKKRMTLIRQKIKQRIKYCYENFVSYLMKIQNFHKSIEL